MDDLVYRGIILKQSNYGEAHRMLSIFTESDGIIKAVRYGIRGKKSSNAAAFQMFSYGDFKLRPSRGEVMTAVSADVKDGFYPISEDITKLSLLTYLADITYGLLGEANPDKRILSLFLNIAYALAYRDENILKLKSVYELKLMCAGGYMPNISANEEYFSLEKGCTLSYDRREPGNIKLTSVMSEFMRYIVNCPDKKMLSFTVSDDSVFEKLNNLTEKYISTQCDRDFSSLDYFKAMYNG